MKKKIVLIIFIIVIMMLTIVSNAATDAVTLKSSKKDVKPGETFTITVSASSENGLNGIDATMEYDENVFEVIESKIVDTTNWMDNLETFPKIATMWKTTTESAKQADIYVVKFKVKDSAEENSKDIKLKGITLSTNGDDITIGDIKETINIKREENKDNSENNAQNSEQGITTPSNNSNNSNNGNNGSNTKNSTSQTKTKVNTNQSTKSAETSIKSEGDSSNKNLPYTGTETNILIIVLIVLVSIFGIISYKLYKKYNI